ncbi:unnamed protein product, partial [Hapterophycus canaliculatus]
MTQTDVSSSIVSSNIDRRADKWLLLIKVKPVKPGLANFEDEMMPLEDLSFTKALYKCWPQRGRFKVAELPCASERALWVARQIEPDRGNTENAMNLGCTRHFAFAVAPVLLWFRTDRLLLDAMVDVSITMGFMNQRVGTQRVKASESTRLELEIPLSQPFPFFGKPDDAVHAASW